MGQHRARRRPVQEGLRQRPPRRVLGVAAQQQIQQAQANPFLGILWWILRTVALLIGFTLLGFLFLRFAPHALTTPVAAIDANPVEAGLWGLLVFALFMAIPLVSAFIVFLIVALWGWGPGDKQFFPESPIVVDNRMLILLPPLR